MRIPVALLAVLVACQAPAPTAPPAATAPPTLPIAIPPTGSPEPSAVPPTASPAPSPAPPAVGASRVETLNAASAALRSGDLKTAAGLYERVLNTPPTGEATAATAAIDSFAHFRLLLTLLADGREDDARTQLEALQKPDPNAPLARLGNQLWDQYTMIGQLRGACAQLQPQVTSQAGPVLAALQGLGVAVDAQTLCFVPPG